MRTPGGGHARTEIPSAINAAQVHGLGGRGGQGAGGQVLCQFGDVRETSVLFKLGDRKNLAAALQQRGVIG